MKKFAAISRVLLGLMFVVFGFDGLFHFFPMPPMPEPANAVIAVLISYHLFFAVKVLEIVAGLLLLSGRFVPLALCLLAPVLFNIVWFDMHLAPEALPVAVILVGLHGVLTWQHRQQFRPLLQPV